MNSNSNLRSFSDASYGSCLSTSDDYLFASVSRFFCSEYNRIAESPVRSAPMVIIPTGNLEDDLAICKAEFTLITSLYREYNKIRISSDQNCVTVSFNEYNNSGYQTSTFQFESNITGAQIKLISFSMPELNMNDNNATCSSYTQLAQSPKLTSFLEQQMMQNTDLFSGGSFYLLNHGLEAGVSIIYQNSTSKFIVNSQNDIVNFQPMQDICTQGCISVCYEGDLVKSIPIVRLDVLNITVPPTCHIGFGDILAQTNGCYIGSTGNDVFNITATSASITSQGGIDTFILHNVPNAYVKINDFRPGIDVIDLESFGNLTSFSSLNITGNPAVVNLPNGQQLELLNVNRTQLNATDFRLSNEPVAGEPLFGDHNPFPTPTLNDHNSAHAHSYLWFLAFPFGICALSLVGGALALAYRYFTQDKPTRGEVAQNPLTGMVLHGAIEIGHTVIKSQLQPSSAVTPASMRFGSVAMPAPLYSLSSHAEHSAIHSPMRSEPYLIPTHSPQQGGLEGGGLSLEFPEGYMFSPVQSTLIGPPPISLPPLQELPGFVTEF